MSAALRLYIGNNGVEGKALCQQLDCEIIQLRQLIAKLLHLQLQSHRELGSIKPLQQHLSQRQMLRHWLAH